MDFDVKVDSSRKNTNSKANDDSNKKSPKINDPLKDQQLNGSGISGNNENQREMQTLKYISDGGIAIRKSLFN